MRIAIFNRSYWPDVTATGQLLTELAEDLVARHGHSVTIVTGFPGEGPLGVPTREVRNGVTIIRAAGTTFRKIRFLGRASNYVTYFLSACLAGLRLPRMDTVIVMTDPPIIGLAGVMSAWRHRARVVFYCCDVFPEVAVLLEDFRSDVVNWALDRINRYLLRRADLVIALGDTMRQRLVTKGAPPERTVVVHTWADCEAFDPESTSLVFRLQHDLGGRFVVMHAGNIGLSQNLDIVLETAERVRHDPRVVFVLIGDGARRASLETRARERGLANVRFLPFQPKERIRESYAAADMFLVSLKPGLAGYIVPSKLYSILAAGRPYVAAVEEECEVAPLTRAHRCGEVVAPGDAEAFAAHIRHFIERPEELRAMGVRARQAGLQFDRPRMTAVFNRVLGAVPADASARLDA